VGSAALYQVDTGTKVTGSDVYTFSTGYERVRSGQISLTSGKEYEVRATSAESGTNPTLNSSRLIIYQESTPLNNTETLVFPVRV